MSTDIHIFTPPLENSMTDHFKTIAPAVSDFADHAAATADSAIQNTRHAADAALNSIQSGVNEMRKEAPTLLTRAAEKAEELARRGIERARDTSGQVKESVTHAGERGAEYVRDDPLKAVLIAAATGAVVALLLSNWSRSNAPRA